jgi:HD superfamily phosphohydrolase
VKSITHRDQIHGDVRYDPLAVALLNTASLQRLGRIYQLGYAHLVYRGATHTRLSHVMGAYHVAGQLVDLLRQNYVGVKILPPGAVACDEFLPKKGSEAVDDLRWDALRHFVRWAALLHDIGHVPLGHTLEDEFEGIYTKHDSFASPRIPHLWNEISPGQDSDIRKIFRRKELLPDSFGALGISGEQAWQTVMLICLHKEKIRDDRRKPFRDVLAEEDESTIPFLRVLKAALANTEGKTFWPYMADIVGNTICADFLDYVRRDPSNVGLDVLRDNLVASRFFIGKDANGLPRMALSLADRRGKPRLDTCTGVVELVRQRFRFAEIIYYHKTKVAASAMLAKAFALVGKPREVGPISKLIEIDQIERIVESIRTGRAEDLARLRDECLPSAILDPDIGDETLLLWLQERAWKALEEARSTGDAETIRRCLRGLCLLQSLVRRSLYKVCFTVDRNTYAEFSPGSKEGPEVERRIQGTLDELRKKETTRIALETQMAAAAGWPDDSLLLYVPPRKSQAKGIETGALDRGDVVTLGTHSAVKGEVARLNEAYKALWRIILLVHPKYSEDAIGLSKAVDALVSGIWPSAMTQSLAGPFQEAAWFHYIPEKQRPAAVGYNALIAPGKPDWPCFDEAGYDTTDGTVSSEEHALRAALLLMVSEAGGSADDVRARFGQPDSLSKRVNELQPQLILEGREGMDAAGAKRATLERIAAELSPTPSDIRLSKPMRRRKSNDAQRSP